MNRSRMTELEKAQALVYPEVIRNGKQQIGLRDMVAVARSRTDQSKWKRAKVMDIWRSHVVTIPRTRISEAAPQVPAESFRARPKADRRWDTDIGGTKAIVRSVVDPDVRVGGYWSSYVDISQCVMRRRLYTIGG